MNIIMTRIKTNRFYRHAMNKHWYTGLDILSTTDDELDDLDNVFSGCAFE